MRLNKTTTITSIYLDITSKMATSTQVDNISKAIGYTTINNLSAAVQSIDNELGTYSATDKNVQNMLSELQKQVKELQSAVTTPVVFVYVNNVGLSDVDITNYLISNDGKLKLSGSSNKISGEVNTVNKTVLYKLPNSSELDTSYQPTTSSKATYTCAVDYTNKTITFNTKQG